ncbi:MAG: response regulator [Anaerolineae bacterium]|nr:response regulator [Anaerolineae bacterium]NUQ06069.1 response regulator [Anaerolineae bacterium]
MTKSRILIVEDDHDLAEMLDAYFRVQNYDVMTAAWGRDALRLSREHTFSLIMLDIRLPDINGYDICRELRRDRRTQDVPIIFLTEKRDRMDKLHGLELGVVDYVTKPFDIQELRLRVRNAINRAAQTATVNPITDLPDQPLVEEKLTGLLFSTTPWSLVALTMVGLNQLRENYGFVAADEVLRAVTLMVRNLLRDGATEEEFLGHLDPEALVLVTTPERAAALRDKIIMRVNLSIPHFYRPQERESGHANYLRMDSGILNSTDGDIDDFESLKAALLAAVTETRLP